MRRASLLIPILCTLVVAGCGDSGEMTEAGACVYAGSGAALARDVEVALDRLALPYHEVDERDVRSGGLNKCSLLIVPGGYTARCIDGLGAEGLERIREFVADGGGYIGICAGAYIAARRVEVPGHPRGLGIIEIENVRSAGTGVRAIFVTQPDHPIVEGCERELQIWYQNGPLIEAGEGVETLAVYEDGSAAIVCSTYGKGRVVIFSPHPEGSLEGGVDAEEHGTLRLLENAIIFASGRRAQR